MHTDHHREARRSAIVRLLRSAPVRRQQELVRLLKREGHAATQSSISRDLRELGVLKHSDGYVLPAHGVYACRANGHAAAVNVGVRPQFKTGRGELIEAFLIDFEGDLYGQQLQVEFLKRLRGERRFPSVEDLVSQMAADVEEARQIAG